MESSGQRDDQSFSVRLYGGVLLWLLFCLCAVLLRGVRWDETYEHALIITRMAPYPEGHPFFRYVRNVFSGQSYLSAAFLWCWPSPAALCGVRNVLQLFFTVTPAFLAAALLTRRVLWGFVAGVFVLLGVHAAFHSYYPIVIWPHFYSVGQIGAGYALVTLACFMGGAWRWGWFLLGLMPAVHVGQVPVLGLAAGLALLHAARRGDWRAVRHALWCCAAGLTICGGFWMAKRGFYVAPPSAGPYAVTGGGEAIWAAYSALHDVHRFLPRYGPFGHTNILLIGSLLLSAAAYRIEGRPRRLLDWMVPRSPLGWVWLYTAGVVAVVWGILLVHRILGEQVPFLLIGWMPYRLANHLPPLLIAGALWVITRRAEGDDARERTPAGLLLLLLAFAAALPLFEKLLPVSVFQRYVGAHENLLFALAGGAFMACGLRLRNDRVFLFFWLGLVVAALAGLVLYHRFGASCAAAGAGVFLAGEMLGRWNARRFLSGAISAMTILVLATLAAAEWRHRSNLPVAPVQDRIVQYLAARGETDALILTPYWDIEWVAHTGHPILADYQTAHLMTYLPTLAPAIKKLHHDLYGFDVDAATPWSLEAWRSRSLASWQQLGEEYQFRYVVSPNEYPLLLTPVLRGEQHTFYEIPAREITPSETQKR